MNRLKKFMKKYKKVIKKGLICNLIKIGLEIFNEKLFDINNGMMNNGEQT